MARKIGKGEALLLAAILLLVVVSVACAKTSPAGDAADFVATFPWLALGIFGLTVSVVGFFLVRTLREYDAKMETVTRRLEQTNNVLKDAVNKIETTITLLFDRDREAAGELSATRSAIAAMEATCKTNRELCGEWKRGITTLERRSVQRRESGYPPPIHLEEPQ